MRQYDDALQVGAVGTSVATGAASARVAIPNNAAGGRAKYVLVTATGNCYIKFGDVTVVATNNDILVPANYPLIFQCVGMADIAYLQLTATQSLNIIPLE